MSENIINKKRFGYIDFPNIGGGFFANFFSAVSNIVTCHQHGLIPYVNSSKTAFAEGFTVTDGAPLNSDNPWDWWFDQETPTDNDIIVPINFDPTINFSHEHRVWQRPDIPYVKTIVDKYIHIKKEILEKVDEYKVKNFDNHVVLGIMARGAEMNAIHPQYGNQTIETWVQGTKDILNKHPEIDVIFMVTEDSNYIPIFLNEFPDTIYLKGVFRKTDETLEDMIRFSLFYCIANTRENHSKILGEECLTQALLLSKCDYLLVKQCGTSSAAIFYGDKIKDVFYA
jgi:hypothetical protein